MTLPASSLLAVVRQGLLTPEQMQEAERLAQTVPSAEVLARVLLGRGFLTAYQAEQLAGGRGYSLVVGKYVLLDRLGKGGMGEVFRPRDTFMERDVALKRMKDELRDQPGAAERFLREVKAAAKLEHINVVRVYDAGDVNGTLFLVMELLPGVDLGRFLHRQGTLSVAEAVEYVRQACMGMQHAHEQKLVHRDLKPANLVLCGGVVKILDMGLAQLAGAQALTQSGAFMGTVDYVAPEQVTDARNVDIRADVYSLGCTLYHLLAGKTAFDDAEPRFRPALHASDREPPAIESLRGDVPAQVAAVVRKMMAKKREQRHQTPGEAADALGAILAGQGRLPVPLTRTPTTIAPLKPRSAVKANLLAGLLVAALALALGCVGLHLVPWMLDNSAKVDGQETVQGPDLLESGQRYYTGVAFTVKIIADEDTNDDKPAALTVNGKLTKLTGGTRTFHSPPLKQGQKYSYTFVAKWMPNNYETYSRTRTAVVSAGDFVTIDMTKKDPNILDDIKIRFVPTPKEFVAEMMKLGKVGKDDVVFDLGCGDGRIVIAAVKDYGAKKGIGIDYDPKRLKECKENAEKAGVTDKLEFRSGDVFKGIPDLKDATVVCMYMSDGLNGQMWPILQKTCKPGTRIVTHRFLMGNEGQETGPPPEKSTEVFSNELGIDYTEKVHLWTIKGEAKNDKEK